MSTAIAIENLSKKYRRYHNRARYDTLRGTVASWFQRTTNAPDVLWALRDFNLVLESGSRLGVLGMNGAGKSTLLKILGRITRPTTGSAVLHGRVASLLEVGTGFHPELTGRENIYFNGAILGLSRNTIKQRLEEIVTFSGVQRFIDTPLKFYSSGMQMRLAFSVAAHLDADILLIDEVLAVGDAAFQKRCLGKIDEISQQQGKTIVFVSHNLQYLQAVCNTGILLEAGRMVHHGPIQEIVQQYSKRVDASAHTHHWALPEETPAKGFTEIIITDNEGNIPDGVLWAGKKYRLQLTIYTPAHVSGSLVSIRITNQQDIPVITSTNGDEHLKFPDVPSGEINYRLPLPVDLLKPGTYRITCSWNIPGVTELSNVNGKIGFEVANSNYPGIILSDGRQEIIYKQLRWELL